MIRWMVENITPEETKLTVQNFLKEEDEEAQRAGRDINAFHDLIMDLALKIEAALKLGIRSKKAPPRNPRNRNPRTGDGGGSGTSSSGRGANAGKGGDTNRQNQDDDKPKEHPCSWCGGKHHHEKCPTIPAKMKK